MANNQLWDYAQKVGEQVSGYVDQAKNAIGAVVNQAQGGLVSHPTQQAQAQGTLAANSNVDPRYAQVQADRNAAMAEMNNTYGGMIGNTDQFYQDQINASKDWADKQAQLQQQQTDFTIEKVEQQKDQARKDYLKEQSGAYVDWQKQSNQYGANAEQQAAAGMAGTGFSESSQVSMYNTYQNRVMVARESYNQAVQNFNNAITEARLQNNSVLAEIAFEAHKEQLKLALDSFQNKNQLILEQANKKMELENIYYDRYLDVLDQINYEQSFAEEVRQYNQNFAEDVRQYNESLALQRDQLEEEKRQYEKTFAENVRQYDKTFEENVRQYDATMAENIRQYNQNYYLQVDKFTEEKRQYDQQYKESVRQFNENHTLKLQEYNESIRQFNEEIARLKSQDAHNNKMDIEQLTLQRDQLKEEKKQFEESQKLKKEQMAEEKRQYDTTYQLNVQKLNEEKRQFEESQKLKLAQLEEEKRQYNETMAYNKSKSSGGGGGGSEGVKVAQVADKTVTVKKATYDPNSLNNQVAQLGYGPLLPNELEAKVASGEVLVRTDKAGNQTLIRNDSLSGRTQAQKKMGKYIELRNMAYK